MKTILNAKIRSVSLGYNEHGHMTFRIMIDASNGKYYIFGDYTLDDYDADQKKRVGTAEGLECIMKILQVVGVNTWEKLEGKYIRIKSDNQHRTVYISSIGNIMEEKWFDIEDYYA